jgi:hypothetical protein
MIRIRDYMRRHSTPIIVAGGLILLTSAFIGGYALGHRRAYHEKHICRVPDNALTPMEEMMRGSGMIIVEPDAESLETRRELVEATRTEICIKLLNAMFKTY